MLKPAWSVPRYQSWPIGWRRFLLPCHRFIPKTPNTGRYAFQPGHVPHPTVGQRLCWIRKSACIISYIVVLVCIIPNTTSVRSRSGAAYSSVGRPVTRFQQVLPLPEGLSELTFAGMLAGRRFRYEKRNSYTLSSDADFVITGEILKGVTKPEGPFGDHLGYYCRLKHDFPVMRVHKVWHRKDPLWHFSVVGRPPMESSGFTG